MACGGIDYFVLGSCMGVSLDSRQETLNGFVDWGLLCLLGKFDFVLVVGNLECS